MALPASTVIAQIRLTMNDPASPPTGGNPAFADSELLSYVDEAQKIVCQIKPDAYTVFETIPLAAGAMQALPIAGNSGSLPVGTQVIDIYSNGADGSTVQMIDRESLDHKGLSVPYGWQATAGEQALVRRWFYDERIPKQFMVSPANNGSGTLNCQYAAVPPALTSDATDLVVDDTYLAALHAIGVAFCYGKQTARYDAQKFQAFMQQGVSLITGRTVSQAGEKPTEVQ
jgi:hypothetical protein